MSAVPRPGRRPPVTGPSLTGPCVAGSPLAAAGKMKVVEEPNAFGCVSRAERTGSGGGGAARAPAAPLRSAPLAGAPWLGRGGRRARAGKRGREAAAQPLSAGLCGIRRAGCRAPTPGTSL